MTISDLQSRARALAKTDLGDTGAARRVLGVLIAAINHIKATEDDAEQGYHDAEDAANDGRDWEGTARHAHEAWKLEHAAAQDALDRRDAAESLLALALRVGLEECERLRGGYAFEYARGCRAGAAACTLASAPPVVEVRFNPAKAGDVCQVCIGEWVVVGDVYKAFAREMADAIRTALTALWPPQVAAGGSWEGHVDVAFVEGHAVITLGKMTVMTNPAVTTTTALAANLRAMIYAATRTLSAPAAGGVPAHGQDVVCGEHWEGLSGCDVMVNGDTGCPWCHVETLKREAAEEEEAFTMALAASKRIQEERDSLRADLAARDAEIGRLRVEVEQMVTRDHVLECVANETERCAAIADKHWTRIGDQIRGAK